MNVILLVSLLVGGFFVNVASIPGWIRWLHYLSVFFYSYATLMTNEVATLSLDFAVCADDECPGILDAWELTGVGGGVWGVGVRLGYGGD
jgi:ABC-type multidrug transport system permease subunit